MTVFRGFQGNFFNIDFNISQKSAKDSTFSKAT